MRQEIFDWYNALRESWGLERIGEEPEDTGDLVLEDFRFRPALVSDQGEANTLHALCSASEISEEEALIGEGRTALVAETARGEIAAVALSARSGDEERVVFLDVRPEYRDWGRGRIVNRLIATVLSGGARSLSVDLPIAAEAFSHVLYREGFSPYEIRFRLDLERKRSETL